MATSTKTCATASQAEVSPTFAPGTEWKDTGGGSASGAEIVSALGTSDDDTDYIGVSPDLAGGLGAFSYALTLTNWGFSLPAGASDLYLQCTIRHRLNASLSPGADVKIDDVRAIVGGSVTGSDVAADFGFTNTSYANVTLGSNVTDSFGISLTQSQANNSNFGVRIIYSGTQDSSSGHTIRQIRLTYVTLTITYSEAETGKRVTVSRWIIG